jgi:hypothetical protein
MWQALAARLRNGETVQFRPKGGSMSGRIESGNLVTVAPLSGDAPLSEKDIVLCKVRGRYYLHLIAAIRGEQYQIANNRGFVNGWIGRSGIFGRCIKVEP